MKKSVVNREARPAKAPRRWNPWKLVAGLGAADKAFCALFSAAILLVAFTFRDYGFSWDEYWHNVWYGDAVLRFFATLGEDLSSTTKNNFYLYGGLFDAPASLLAKVLPLTAADARHLANACAGLTGLLGCFMTARLAGGPVAGFWAALFLLLSAPYYGHMFINSKDIPFAAAAIWAVYAILRFVRELPSPPVRLRVFLGIALGAALGVRTGGVLYLFFLFLLFPADLVFTARAENANSILPRAGKTALSVLPSLAIAYVVMIALWPAALLKPLAIPLESVRAFSNFSQAGWILWNGDWIFSANRPAAYLPVLFGVELPEPVVVLFPAAAAWSAFTLFRAGRRGDRDRFLSHFLLLLAIFFAPVYATIRGATLYDNMRHLLFVLPPMACIAGMAWAGFLEKIVSWRKPVHHALIALMAVSLSFQAMRMVDLHPYEYTFKNIFAGGMPKAAERFETEYWITSYAEATRRMLAHARRVAAAEGVPFESRRFTVAVTGDAVNVVPALPPNFRAFTYHPPESSINFPPDERTIARLWRNYDPRSDYVIATTRQNTHKMSPGWEVLSTVGRAGMDFSVVKVSPRLSGVR